MANPMLGIISLPCPTNSSIEPLVKKAEVTTVGGNTTRRIFGYKYIYKLNWDFMTYADYIILKGIFEQLIQQTFTWDKYPQSASGISVLMNLTGIEPKTVGDQTTDYYSKVELTLQETVKR